MNIGGDMQQDDIFSAAQVGGGDLPYYYSTPARNGLLQQVIHFIRFGEGLPIVQGASGSGKSTLANQLLTQLQPETIAVHVNAGAYSGDFSALLNTVVEEFGLPAGDQRSSGELMVSLRHFSRALTDDKRLGVLVVDDAQELDDQALGGLISLLQGQQIGGSGFHLVLFAAEEFVSRVDALGLLDVPVYDFDVPSFSPTELSGFLRGVCGGELSSESLQSIWGASRGFPGAALSLFNAQSQLELGADQERAESRISGLPIAHIVAFSVLVAVLLWVFFSSDSVDELDIAVGDEVAGNMSVEDAKVSDVEGASVSEGPAPAVVTVDPPVGQNDGGVVLDREEVQLESPQESIGKPVGGVSLPSGTVELSVVPEKVGSPDVNPVEPSVKPAKPVKTEVGEEVTDVSLSEHERFLLAQNGDAYTLQILAASQKDALMKYVRRQSNSSSLRIYQGVREGKQLFVVVVGVYPTRKEALSAIIDLPLVQRQGGPWPRQLKTVHADIRENRRK